MTKITKRPSAWTNRYHVRPKPAPLPPPREDGFMNTLLSRIGTPSKEPDDLDGFDPIANFDAYIAQLERANHPPEVIEQIKDKHARYWLRHPPQPPQPIRPPEPKISHVDQVVSTTTTGSDGETNVRAWAPFEKFYSTDAKDMPDLYRNAGYSEEFVKEISAKIAYEPERQRLANLHFDEVMSKYSGKSAPKTKRRNLRARYSRFRPKILLKSDIQEDDSDAGSDGEADV